MAATVAYIPAEAYIGNEPSLDLRVPEARTQEMADVLSRCLPSFHRTACRYLGNATEAEDAVQDALLAAYKHLDQFKGQSQMSTWLTAIVANCARMRLRRRPRQAHLSLDERFGDEHEYSWSERLADDAPSPEDECRKSELHGHLEQFMTQLSPPLRKAFQLREMEGLSTSEAARILGVADGTVKAQLARARAKLTKLMRRTLEAQPGSALARAALPGRRTVRRKSVRAIYTERCTTDDRAPFSAIEPSECRTVQPDSSAASQI
jgi:RNA polymerase sigma factor (sigma-70 family)